jgi:hypothetical protein
MKTIWMVSGNKGGVGKSLFCLSLASALEMLGESYSVLDGDGRVGDVFATFTRKCPARQGDFRQLRPDSHLCKFDSVYEGMLHQLLRGTNDLIVNTPDGADQILSKWFDVTLAHSEPNNIQFKFIYLMSPRPDGLDMLLELAGKFSFLYPIRNLHFGSSDLFAGFNREYARLFNEVIDFPSLRGDEARMLFDLQTYPLAAFSAKQKATQSFCVPVMSRARLFAWQKRVNDALYGLISNKDTSNIKQKA